MTRSLLFGAVLLSILTAPMAQAADREFEAFKQRAEEFRQRARQGDLTDDTDSEARSADQPRLRRRTETTTRQTCVNGVCTSSEQNTITTCTDGKCQEVRCNGTLIVKNGVSTCKERATEQRSAEEAAPQADTRDTDLLDHYPYASPQDDGGAGAAH